MFFQAGLLAEVAGFCPLPSVWAPPPALVSAALGLVPVLGFSWGFAWVDAPAVPGFVSAPAPPVVLPAAAPLLPLAVGFGVVLALLVSLGGCGCTVFRDGVGGAAGAKSEQPRDAKSGQYRYF